MAGQPKTQAKVQTMIARSGGQISVVEAKKYVRNGIASKVIAELTRGEDPRSVALVDAPPVSRMPKARSAARAKPMDVSGDLEGLVAAVTTAASGGDTNKVFQELREESLKFALEIMRMELDPDERSFGKLLEVKKAITMAVFTTTTRVRPGDLRDRDDDGVGALLAKVRAESGEAERVLTAAEMLS